MQFIFLILLISYLMVGGAIFKDPKIFTDSLIAISPFIAVIFFTYFLFSEDRNPLSWKYFELPLIARIVVTVCKYLCIINVSYQIMKYSMFRQ